MCACTPFFQCQRHRREGVWAGEEWNEDLLPDPSFEERQDAYAKLGDWNAKRSERDA